ncbi:MULTISPECIES: PP2C family protein-serine/threonine phosphatase [Amycolatopsis]|uniref:Protein phosphatase n=1 Tax=Amycolatopsis thermoflava TaxID=84480 RepID=A0A3N2GRV1_9PSEU|nr:protein phosphatase 2C domain-containing protein [Amycolatopsis thermoflava]ROS39356.1 protein phosphatase [Amycolatopsis thermoflava]
MHRLTSSPVWATATARGPRSVNADATAAYTDPSTGEVVFALADGVGDEQSAARAAQVAVATAVQVPASQGPAAALAAAQRAVRAEPAGDCVLVVATPVDGGYRVGWVGDVRAYAWDGDSLRQLTRDHTLAQYFRDRGQVPTPRMEHLVTTSVRTARPEEFGHAVAVGPAGLLLTSDGVHKVLTRAAMAELLRVPSNSAHALVDAVLAAGGHDNATALMADLAPALPDLTTTPLPTVTPA